MSPMFRSLVCSVSKYLWKTLTSNICGICSLAEIHKSLGKIFWVICESPVSDIHSRMRLQYVRFSLVTTDALNGSHQIPSNYFSFPKALLNLRYPPTISTMFSLPLLDAPQIILSLGTIFFLGYFFCMGFIITRILYYKGELGPRPEKFHIRPHYSADEVENAKGRPKSSYDGSNFLNSHDTSGPGQRSQPYVIRYNLLN
ncbi:uncharacterized protein BDR25DRAFT_356108 [Lindgomyces ingoldianus]|uniref:Uncharacterized protein n=1 Tax=Lindgomyces ingoldianus TaxID=673940 RepID=A0ACB6QUV7_9PLEO|nr:uncharacterized protein BDR25DRAFT_356108 [Lindgomyces ingoldianus]KAF2469865.1 hypothetical protein BDR25DRAFT_356108 [Lindgomyces ingoldianus]